MVPYIENNDEVLPKEVPWGVYYDEDVHENLYKYFHKKYHFYRYQCTELTELFGEAEFLLKIREYVEESKKYKR